VLLIAEACNPRWSSVPLVGYNLAKALAVRPDLEVTLATQVRNRAGLEADPITARARVAFIDTEAFGRPFFRLRQLLRGGAGLSWTINTALAWPAYMVFEKKVFRHFADPLRRHEFDIVHRVTPVSPTLGSPLASLVDIPMLIGPLNGGLPWPKEYPGLRRREREWLVPVRRLYRYLPYYRSTYRRLAGVVSGSYHTASEVPSDFQGRRYYLPENAVDPECFPIADAWPEPESRFRFITIGRMVPYKAMDLILEAMAGSPALRGCELVLIGDGPERAPLEAQAAAAGLRDAVRFAGWVDQVALAGALRQAQAFVFPSLREFGGAVVLEAMASGLPAIVVNYGGPGELTTDECGIRLPLAPRAPLVQDLRAAMEALAADPDRCRRLGAAACRRVRQHFTWNVKAARIVEIYHELIHATAATGQSAVAHPGPVLTGLVRP
jgi:glycosyltransferase involved in cell wall biosynthesis